MKSMNDFLKKYPQVNSFLTDSKWLQVRNVLLFMIITISIHLLWRFWAHTFNYAPVSLFMYQAMDAMASWVFRQSIWIINHILCIQNTVEQGQIIWLRNGCGIQITASCSGLKPILQFVLLFLIFPGSWKKKAWFIPLGVIIVHITNLVRVCGMAVAGALVPNHLQFIHDNILKAMFYVVIFGLWWFWVEKINSKKV
jgi:exosortase/archaeosortase family protein